MEEDEVRSRAKRGERRIYGEKLWEEERRGGRRMTCEEREVGILPRDGVKENWREREEEMCLECFLERFRCSTEKWLEADKVYRAQVQGPEGSDQTQYIINNRAPKCPSETEYVNICLRTL